MIVDGKRIAKDVEERVARAILQMKISPTLALVYGGNNEAQQQYLGIKTKIAERLGVHIRHVLIPEEASTNVAISMIKTLAEDSSINGIVVQLPLPHTIEYEQLLRCIPKEKDVDVLSPNARGLFRQGTFPVLPPVAAAIAEICRVHNISIEGKHAVVVGHGRLVGAPVALWLRHNDVEVTVIDKHVENLGVLTKEADIIVLGTGRPNTLLPEMIKDGVIIFDAGTSDTAGTILGDADPKCATNSSLFTPVPGGIGPITVMMLFQNLVILTKAT